MSKLLKSWKILSFGVMTAALGLMMASCVETGNGNGEEEIDTVATRYTVSVGFEDIETDEVLTGVVGSSGAGSYTAGQTVTLVAGTKAGYEFMAWTSDDVSSVFGVGNNNFDLNPITTFTMPARNVRITGWYQDTSEVVVLEPMVRFSWRLEDQPSIQSIAANVQDVSDWYNDIFLAEEYDPEDATDYPTFEGSPDLPLNLYSRTLHAEDGSPHKSVYFDIEEGNFTAVCTVEDPVQQNSDGTPHLYDIVANYSTLIGLDDKSFFEVAFDVGYFLEGDDDTGWFDDKYDNGNTTPRLEKKRAGKLLKKIKKNNVTYYVFKRATK